MSQIRITKQRRTAGAWRHGQAEPPLPLDPRDPDVSRVKQLQRSQAGTAAETRSSART